MPVDEHGTRAEVIMDGGSIVNRLNPARLTEQYFNGALDEAWRRVKYMKDNGVPVNEIYDFLLKLYWILSPKFHAIVQEKGNPKEHVDNVYKDGVYIWLPTDNPVDYIEVRRMLDEHCPPHEGKIQYKLADGIVIVPERNVLIADQYFIFLEKIGDDYSSVASPAVQPQGVPGKLTRADKWSSSGRPQAIRGVGETEMRLLNTLTDPQIASDLLDVANSPTTHRYVCRRLLTDNTPTYIDDILPRDVIPRGNNRITQQVENSLLAGGFGYEAKPTREDM